MADNRLKALGVRMRPACIKRLDKLCEVNDCRRRQVLERLVDREFEMHKKDTKRRIAP